MRRAVPLWRTDYIFEPLSHQSMTGGMGIDGERIYLTVGRSAEIISGLQERVAYYAKVFYATALA
jgi:hypothetical protein